MDMNLYSIFSEVDPTIYGHGEGATFREDMGEFQFFWRGDETKTNEVYKALGEFSNHVTHIERLK